MKKEVKLITQEELLEKIKLSNDLAEDFKRKLGIGYLDGKLILEIDNQDIINNIDVVYKNIDEIVYIGQGVDIFADEYFINDYEKDDFLRNIIKENPQVLIDLINNNEAVNKIHSEFLKSEAVIDYYRNNRAEAFNDLVAARGLKSVKAGIRNKLKDLSPENSELIKIYQTNEIMIDIVRSIPTIELLKLIPEDKVKGTIIDDLIKYDAQAKHGLVLKPEQQAKDLYNSEPIQKINALYTYALTGKDDMRFNFKQYGSINNAIKTIQNQLGEEYSDYTTRLKNKVELVSFMINLNEKPKAPTKKSKLTA